MQISASNVSVNEMARSQQQKSQAKVKADSAERVATKLQLDAVQANRIAKREDQNSKQVQERSNDANRFALDYRRSEQSISRTTRPRQEFSDTEPTDKNETYTSDKNTNFKSMSGNGRLLSIV